MNPRHKTTEQDLIPVRNTILRLFLNAFAGGLLALIFITATWLGASALNGYWIKLPYETTPGRIQILLGILYAAYVTRQDPLFVEPRDG